MYDDKGSFTFLDITLLVFLFVCSERVFILSAYAITRNNIVDHLTDFIVEVLLFSAKQSRKFLREHLKCH